MAEAIRVSPTEKRPTHHVKLIKAGGATIGLVAVDARGEFDVRAIRKDPANPRTTPPQRYGGRWDNRQPPYIRIIQDDFSGGQGKRDFEANRTSFRDSGWLWSASEGKIHPAARYNLTTGYRDMLVRFPGDGKYQSLYGAQRYIAAKVTPASGFDINYLRLLVRRVGNPTGVITAAIYSDAAGSPGTLQRSQTIAASSFTDVFGDWWVFYWTTSFSLVGATSYWVVVSGPAADGAANHYDVLCSPSGVSAESKISSDGTTWNGTTTLQLYYVVEDNAPGARRFLFLYKRMLHMLVSPVDGTTPKLYRNGFMGVALGTQDKLGLTATGASFPAGGLVGQVCILIEGQGEEQERTVISNTATRIEVATATYLPEAWDVAPLAQGTAYAIVGGDVWYEVVPSAGVNFETVDDVTDVVVADETIYFCRAGDATIRRHRYYPVGASGSWVWTQSVASEAGGANKADLLTVAYDSVDKVQVYRAQNIDVNGNRSVSHSAIPAWGTDLTFSATPTPIGDRNGKIRSLMWHDALIWIGREDSLWNMKNDVADNVLPDMAWMRSPRNAVAMAVQTPVLLFNYALGLERVYGRDVDDFGPNRGEGIPSAPINRQGVVTQILPAVRYIFIGHDGTDYGSSTVYISNKIGWHELVRPPRGERILDSANKGMLIQALTGKPARIWVCTEKWVGYFEMPEFGTEPSADSRIRWNHEAYAIPCRFTDNTLDIDKWWGTLKVFSKNLSAGVAWIEVDYRVDDAAAWTPIATKIETSPSQVLTIGDGLVVGKVLELRLRLYTTNGAVRPEQLGLAIDAIARYKTNWIYTLDFVLTDIKGKTPDLEDASGQGTAATINAFLTAACEDPIPMTFDCVLEEFHGKKVLVEPHSLRPIEWTKGEDARRLVGHVALMEAL